VKPFQEYAAQGYYVAREAIPGELIRPLIATFHGEAKHCNDPQLRQNTKRESNQFDVHGFMTVPLVQPHLSINPALRSFRESVLNLSCSEEMRASLQQVTLAPKHCLQQVMIFEQSATPAHQDWVYLDSFPPGNMTAAWVALEDIHPDATRFFVVPGSQAIDRVFPEEWIWNSTRYTDAIMEIVRTEFSRNMVVPEMRTGDILFWNSRLIHGSMPGTDPTKSRLSLTAHYIPDGFGFGKRSQPIVGVYPFKCASGKPITYFDPAH